VKAVPALDVGSGKNPFLFRYPCALTVNHPATAQRYANSQGATNHCFPADAHFYRDAKSGIDFPPCSVEAVLLHYVVGESGNRIITASESAKLFASIYLALVPGGSVYIRSIFRQHDARGIDAQPFCSALIAGGFSLKDIDLIPARSPETDTFCKIVVIESDDLEGIPEDFPDKSSFLIAQKAISESNYV
jgi:hypothetical protein